MNTLQIKCFLAAAECLNFTKVAERLYMSQPGISRQISAIEREIGIELFERGRNSVKLTEAGTICAAYLTSIMADYQKMVDEAAMAQRSKQDSLIIGGLEGQLIGECYESSLMYLWQNHPDIRIKMCYFNVSELCEALVNGDVDIGIMPEAEAERLPGVLYRRSHIEECCLVIPGNHPKAARKTRRFRTSRTRLSWSWRERFGFHAGTAQACLSQAAVFRRSSGLSRSYGTLVMLWRWAGDYRFQYVHALRHCPSSEFWKLPDSVTRSKPLPG
jgi:DNA-binding transcriptional LysR family regulator